MRSVPVVSSLSVIVDRLARNQRAHDPALKFASSKGEFLALERSSWRSSIQGVPRSTMARSAGAPLSRRPAGRPSRAAGRAVIAREQILERDVARMHEPERRRQQRLQGRPRHRPHRRTGGACRRCPAGSWLDTMTSIDAIGDALDHRLAIVLGAQRRPHLVEGAVGADVVLVERQVIDGYAAGDLEACASWRRGWHRGSRGRRSARRDSGRPTARPAGCRARP